MGLFHHCPRCPAHPMLETIRIPENSCREDVMNLSLRRCRSGTILIGAFAVMILLSGCATTETVDKDSFRAAIEDIYEKSIVANRNKDVDLHLSLWDEEGIKMNPQKPLFVGKSVLGERKRQAYAKWNYLSQDITIEDVQVDGNWGFVRGSAKATVAPVAGGDSVASEKKFLTIFKRQPDGSWKVYLDFVG
jgi:ketosteroid isomerase-like protein